MCTHRTVSAPPSKPTQAPTSHDGLNGAGELFERAILVLSGYGFAAKRMVVRLATDLELPTLAVSIRADDSRIAWTGPMDCRRPAGHLYRSCGAGSGAFTLFSGFGSEGLERLVNTLIDGHHLRDWTSHPMNDLGEWDPHTALGKDLLKATALSTVLALRAVR